MAKKKKQTEQKPLTQADIQKVMEIAKNDISNSTSVDGNFSISNSNSATINPNTQSTPLTDTQLQARQYIQSIYDSNASVPTSNNNEIPSLKDNYVQGSNPNIPDEDARMKARDYINNVMNGKINEDGTLNEQKKQNQIKTSSLKNVNTNAAKNVPSSKNKKEEIKEEVKEETKQNTIPSLSAKEQNKILLDAQNSKVFGKNKSEGIDKNKPLSAVEQNAIYQATHNGSLGKTSNITKKEEKEIDQYDVKGNLNKIIKGDSQKPKTPSITIKPNMTKQEMENEQKKLDKYAKDTDEYYKNSVEAAKQGVKEYNNSIKAYNLLAKANKNMEEIPTVPENAFQWSKELGKFKNDEERVNYLYKKGELNSDEEALAEKLTDNFFNQEKYGKAENRLSLLNYFDSFGTGDEGVAEEIKKRFNMTDAEYKKAKSYYNLKYKSDDAKAVASGFANALPFYSIGMSNSNLPSAKEEYDRQSKTMESNPFSTLTGTFASKGLQYAVGNKFIGKFIGGESALANIGKGQIADTVLDTIPTITNNVVNGEYDTKDGFDFAKLGLDILKNQGENLAYNVGSEGLEALGKQAFKKIAEKKALKSGIQTEEDLLNAQNFKNHIDDALNTVENNALVNNADSLKNLENNVANNLVEPTENIVKNADNEIVENIENIAKQNNVPQNVPQMAENVSQVPQNVAKPKVEYNTKNVEGFTRMDSNLTSMQKMFGDSTTEPKVAQMKALLNEYATTGNIEAYNQAKQIADELDGYLKGSKYNTKKGRTIKYGDTDTFSFEVENSANAMNNMASVRSVDIPGHEELNSKIDNLVADFGANDDSSKIAIELKQSINELSNDTSVDNLRAVQQKTQDLYYSLENSEKLTNAYRNKTQKFGYDDIKEIADETEQIYKDSVTDYRGNKAEYKPIENVADTKPINNIEDSVPTKPLPDQVNDIGEVKSTDEVGLKANDVPKTNDVGMSKVYTNTLENNKLASMVDEVDRRAALYDKHHNADTLNNAMERVNADKDAWLEKYVSGSQKITDDTDVDTTMLLIQDRVYQSELARMSGDFETADKLQNQAYILKSRLRKAGTKAGQEIQAFAKWNGTSEGAVLNANRILDEEGKTWSKRNGRKSQKVEQFADVITNKVPKNGNKTVQGALDELVKEDIPKLEKVFTHDELREQVKTTLDNEFSSIAKEFTDTDYDYIANLVENGVTKNELAEMLKTRLASGIWDISDDTVQKVNEIFALAQKEHINSKARVELESEAFGLLANEIGQNKSIVDKLDSWRYLAMLGNPKTHIRNILGNTMFQGVTSTSNTLAALMEEAVDRTSKGLGKGGIERTKAILNPVSDSDLIKACKEDSITRNYRPLSGGTKYKETVKGQIKGNADSFDNKFLNWLDKKNSKALDTEDFVAMQQKYKTSLAGYLKANGLDETIFDIEKQYDNLKSLARDGKLKGEALDRFEELELKVDKLNKGREYAVKQAEYSAFHEDNAFASAMTEFSRKFNESDNPLMRVGGKIIEGILPFKKTPANILRSGAEFSPLGLVKNLTYDLGKLAKGNMSASQFIENLSKGLTGTGIMYLGGYLYSKGILDTVNNDTKYQDQLEGKQSYSIKIGDKTYTADFLAPSVMPLFMGVEARKIWDSLNTPMYDEKGFKVNEGGDFYSTLDTILTSSSRLASPILETSMLSGINNTLSDLSQAENKNDVIGTFAANTLTGYGTQMIPTVLGQFARAIDPTRRSTYTDSGNGFIGNLDKTLQKTQNKIPFLSMLNEPYVNTRGEEQNNGIMKSGNGVIDFLGNLAYQSMSPTYVANEDIRPQDTQAREVYNNMSDPKADVFEDYKTSKKVNGNPVSPEEYTTYQKAKGQSDDEIRNLLATTYKEQFDELPQEAKEEVLKKINTLSDKIGTASIVEGYSSKDDLYNAYVEGGKEGVINKIFNDQNTKNAKSKLEEMGIPVNDVTKEAYANNKQGTLNAWKKANAKAQEYGLESISTSQYKKYDECSSRDKDKYLEYIAEIKKTGSESSADGTKEGFEAYKNGTYGTYIKEKNAKEERANDDVSKALQSLSVYSEDTRNRYDNAKKEIPSLKPREYANTVRKIDTNKNGVSQDELIAYFNKNNVSQSEATKMWKAYGKSDWKSVPVLQGKTYKKKKK